MMKKVAIDHDVYILDDRDFNKIGKLLSEKNYTELRLLIDNIKKSHKLVHRLSMNILTDKIFR